MLLLLRTGKRTGEMQGTNRMELGFYRYCSFYVLYHVWDWNVFYDSYELGNETNSDDFILL